MYGNFNMESALKPIMFECPYVYYKAFTIDAKYSKLLQLTCCGSKNAMYDLLNSDYFCWNCRNSMKFR